MDERFENEALPEIRQNVLSFRHPAGANPA